MPGTGVWRKSDLSIPTPRHPGRSISARNGAKFLMYDIKAGEGLYPHSSNTERDEEELQWAAFERLPSVKCHHHTILRHTSTSRGAEVVDVQKLDYHGRQSVLERDFDTNEQDNTNLLVDIKDRFDRIGLEISKVEVRFNDLTISSEVHVGKRELPTLYIGELTVRETFDVAA